MQKLLLCLCSFILAMSAPHVTAEVPHILEQNDSIRGYGIFDPINAAERNFGLERRLIAPALRTVKLREIQGKISANIFIYTYKYELCAANNMTTCVKVPAVFAPQVELFQAPSDSQNKAQIGLRFHGVPGSAITTSEARIFGEQFRHAVSKARKDSHRAASGAGELKADGDDDEGDGSGPIVIEVVEVNGTTGGGGGGTWFFEIQNIFFEQATADAATPEAVCKAGCDKAYDKASDVCHALRNPRTRALCWPAAAVAYGACLAGC